MVPLLNFLVREIPKDLVSYGTLDTVSASHLLLGTGHQGCAFLPF